MWNQKSFGSKVSGMDNMRNYILNNDLHYHNISIFKILNFLQICIIRSDESCNYNVYKAFIKKKKILLFKSYKCNIIITYKL